MRAAPIPRFVVAALALFGAPVAAHAQDVAAAAPHDISVTVYRDPSRRAGGFNLNELGGFALITETRRVVLTPGEHKLRFEGVADGIEPASAIVTGLPSGVVEKNRDAALLSPSALIEKAQEGNGRVQLARTNPKTGMTTRTEGKILSGADGGVVFQTAAGIEALRCSGLPETFAFETGRTGLSPVPTLSVLTRVAAPVEAEVQLSYLARGFDWAADYTIDMKAGGKMDLGAWVTLANGNGVSFKDARVQIVAGRVNRESGEVEPISIGEPILARCWPLGSTSDIPEFQIERVAVSASFAMPSPPPSPMAARAMDKEAIIVTGAMVMQEQLGDLKLYRVPERTTVASRQSKQVRLLDKADVAVAKIYEQQFSSGASYENPAPVPILLRTTNDEKHGLGVPLPSGRVAVFELAGANPTAQRLLSGAASLRDIAVNEETEFRLEEGSADVRASQVVERRTATGAPPLKMLPGPGIQVGYTYDDIDRIELTNARPSAAQVEVRLTLSDGQRLVRADQPVGSKNGRPIFRVTVPSNGSLTIRYQTASRR